MKVYTGIGARVTPPHVLRIMEDVAAKLAREGWTLRSGGASGADSAFYRGSIRGGGKAEIFRPHDCTYEAERIAARYHRAWARLSGFVKQLHGRSVFQVLGRDMRSPSAFVMCWTPDGCTDHAHRSVKTGGTGTAISVASGNGIQIFNLARPDHMRRVRNWLKGD
jgi:hypothetical protein